VHASHIDPSQRRRLLQAWLQAVREVDAIAARPVRDQLEWDLAVERLNRARSAYFGLLGEPDPISRDGDAGTGRAT
jgi:hypothetical protein